MNAVFRILYIGYLRLKPRLHIRVMREAWCVMRIARLHMYVKKWCVMRQSYFCWRSHPVRISWGFFHTRGHGTLSINVSTSIASAILRYFPKCFQFGCCFYIPLIKCYIVLGVPQPDWSTSPDTYHQSHHYISITIKAAQIRVEDYVMFKWVCTWLSLDHMQGSWVVPGRIHKMTSW